MEDAGRAPAQSPPGGKRRRRAGLFSKYFAFIVLLVCGGLVASGAIGLYFSYQETRNSLASLQREKALTAAVRIDHFVRDVEAQLAWTSLPFLDPAQRELESRRLDFLKVLRLVPAVTTISHLDGNGREQVRVSRLAPDVMGSAIDYSADPRFVEARKGSTWFGPVYFRQETEPYMLIAIPEARDRPGATVVEVNLKFIWDEVSRIRIGQRGLAYVVDGKGYLVAHPDISLVLRKVDLSNLPQVREALAARNEREWTQPREARDIEGKPVLSAYAHVAATGWLVFVEEPVEAVFAPLYDSVLRTALLLLAGLVISVFASIFLARRMVSPVRELQRGAERIGSGDLDSRIEVRTNDELEDLAGRFNTMTDQLRESYAGLERKVEERTAELREALDQQTATADVLKVISSSPTDVLPVFNAIVRSARELGEANAANAFSFDGERIHFVTSTNESPAWRDMLRDLGGWLPDRTTMSGRVILSKSVETIEDMAHDPEYSKQSLAITGEHRCLGIPLLRDGAPIGVLTVGWRESGSVPEKFVRVLQTFADQAVIAVENVRLFNEIQAKGRELEGANRDMAEALDQQTAVAEILRVISSSPTDVQPVLDAIAHHAGRICGADNASVSLRRGDMLAPMAAAQKHEMIPPFVLDRTSVIGRCVVEGRTLAVADLQAEGDEYSTGKAQSDVDNARAVIGTPLMLEGAAIGGIALWRRRPEPFTARQVELAETFARQAVIAMENVRLFNEIQDKSRQLEIANKHKSDFLANMSHELRTPLNAIIGFSEVMLSGMTGPLPEKQKEFTGDIRDSGKHLLALINDILDLSKIEAGRMELDVTHFDLREASANAMTLVRGRADRQGIRLESDIAPEVGAYNGDERKFKQIVLNLLTNAVKFTPEGGTVTLGAQRMNGAYVFSVKDTGVGIGADDQQIIFEEFRQVGTDYERKAEGTGLGLALTRRLVQLHGGEISVESAPGYGSTFTFTLPIGTQ